MMLRVLMVTLVSTCLGEDPDARLHTRLPQGHIEYSDPNGLKVNWKLYAPYSQWKSRLENSQRKTQHVETAVVQTEVQSQIQSAIQVGQPKPDQVLYKSYDHVPSHIKQLLRQVYGTQAPYFDHQAFSHKIPLQVQAQVYNQEPTPQSQKNLTKHQITEYGPKPPLLAEYNDRTLEKPQTENTMLLPQKTVSHNRHNKNVPLKIQSPVHHLEQPDLQQVQYTSYNQVPSRIKQIFEDRETKRPFVQPEVIVHRIPFEVLPRAHNQAAGSQSQKGSMKNQMMEYGLKSLMLARYNDRTLEEPQAESTMPLPQRTISRNRYSKNVPLEIQSPVHHLEQPDLQQVQYTSYNQVPSRIKQIFEDRETERPYVQPEVIVHRIPFEVLPRAHDQAAGSQSQKSFMKNQMMEYRPKYLTQTRYNDEDLKEPHVENKESLPETWQIQPISPYRNNVPLRIQQLLQFQAQIPYNVIANRIVYRPKTIFVPKPLPQSEKGAYEYRSQVYIMDDARERNEQRSENPNKDEKDQ